VYATNSYGTTSSLSYGLGANITILAVPSTPGTPVIINSGSNIIVTWTQQTTVTLVTNYTILFGTVNGTWATTSYCNGANATTLVNLNCTIP